MIIVYLNSFVGSFKRSKGIVTFLIQFLEFNEDEVAFPTKEGKVRSRLPKKHRERSFYWQQRKYWEKMKQLTGGRASHIR